jgi:microcystin-dependent protein
LQVDIGASSTTFGGSASFFDFTTDLGKFYFNKPLQVNGKIQSYQQDTVLGPSNNDDTYLKVYAGSTDKIEAKADEFLVQGDSKYLQMKFTTEAAELKTNASKIYINNELEVKEKVTASSFVGHGTIPIGGIIMWSGSDEPDGWALCNGQTKDGKTTPDLRNRFIVGSGGEYNNGWTGGQKSVTLTQSQMPSHNHTGTTNNDGAHEHTANGSMNVASGSDGVVVYVNAPASGRHGVIYPRGSEHQHAFTTNATGGSQAHENRPPYYALAYLMRVK